MGGLKLFYTPPKLLVCVGGLKTESGKFHEIITSVWGGLKTLYPPPEKLLVYVWGGGLKTETGKFLLHFQNFKLNNGCRSVYGTDIITHVPQLNYPISA